MRKEEKRATIIGLFDDPESLLDGARAVRQGGCTGIDALTPYPVHGLDEALDLKASWMPRVTKTAFFAGATLGFAFQAWVLDWTWRINIAGKPFLPVPALMPVAFECGILIAGISTFVATLIALRLRPTTKYSAIDAGVSDDRFALLVPAEPTQENEIRVLLERSGAAEVRTLGT
jgi:hypothetical protein